MSGIYSRPATRPANPRLVADAPSIDGSLLAEVCRVQHDKTIQAVRDLIDGIPISAYGERRYSERTAKEFRDDLIAGLRALRDEGTR